MSRVYPKEVRQFIKDNVNGMYCDDLVKAINLKFGTSYTIGQIKGYKKNNHLKSNVPTNIKSPRTQLFPQDIKEFVVKNVTGITTKELTDKVNKSFNTAYSEGQIKRLKSTLKIKSGLNTTFKKGFVPVNKGKYGHCSPGCEVTWFKKGGKPLNAKPVGTESLRSDGYVYVKVEEPNRWKLKHKMLWEEANGKVPKGMFLLFLDGNRSHTDISNLELVSKNIIKLLNVRKLISSEPELTRTGIMIAKTVEAQQNSKKRLKGRKKNG